MDREAAMENEQVLHQSASRYYFCVRCGQFFSCELKHIILTIDKTFSNCEWHAAESVPFSSPLFDASDVAVLPDFISELEETQICATIDTQYTWKESQSGRRKQDFGPKANFKRRKVSMGNFTGFAGFSEFLLYRMASSVDELKTFTCVELCNLEYAVERGSCIVPHTDDSWLWGERLVTLSYCASTFLSLTHSSMPQITLKIPLMRRSLMILKGRLRYDWKHAVLQSDINSRRIATTFRELSEEFRTDEKWSDLRKDLFERTRCFNGKVSS